MLMTLPKQLSTCRKRKLAWYMKWKNL